MKTLTQTLTVTKAAFPPQELLPGTRDHTFSYVWGNYLTPTKKKVPALGGFEALNISDWSTRLYHQLQGVKAAVSFYYVSGLFFLNFLLLNFHGPLNVFLFPWKQKFL